MTSVDVNHDLPEFLPALFSCASGEEENVCKLFFPTLGKAVDHGLSTDYFDLTKSIVVSVSFHTGWMLIKRDIEDNADPETNFFVYHNLWDGQVLEISGLKRKDMPMSKTSERTLFGTFSANPTDSSCVTLVIARVAPDKKERVSPDELERVSPDELDKQKEPPKSDMLHYFHYFRDEDEWKIQSSETILEVDPQSTLADTNGNLLWLYKGCIYILENWKARNLEPTIRCIAFHSAFTRCICSSGFLYNNIPTFLLMVDNSVQLLQIPTENNVTKSLDFSGKLVYVVLGKTGFSWRPMEGQPENMLYFSGDEEAFHCQSLKFELGKPGEAEPVLGCMNEICNCKLFWLLFPKEMVHELDGILTSDESLDDTDKEKEEEQDGKSEGEEDTSSSTDIQEEVGFKGMHPRVSVDGFDIVKRATLQFLEKFKTPAVMGDELDKKLRMLYEALTDIIVNAVEGLVLEITSRNPDMKRRAEDCYIFTCNISLEYENSEKNAVVINSNAEQREAMVVAERQSVDERLRKIIQLKQEVCAGTAQSFLIKNRNGMDYPSVDMLARAGVTKSTNFNELVEREPWLSLAKLVVKPDMLYVNRGEGGLVALNLDLAHIAQFVKKRLGKEVEMGGCKGPITTFIVEPFVPHNEEFYLIFISERLGCSISFSECGGIDIEENWDKNKSVIEEFIKVIFTLFSDLDFTFLEMNPLTLVDAKPYPFDTRGEVDDTAAFKNFKKWGNLEFPFPFRRVMSPTESFIHRLDEKTSASLKFTVLNPKGRIWTMVAGGGASFIYADTVSFLV